MKNVQFNIRPVLLCDLEKLTEIGELTFREAFEALNDPEDFEHYVKNNLSLEIIREEWNDPKNAFFLLEHEREVAGYLKLQSGKQPSCVPGSSVIGLERIYLKNDKQNLGLGQKLFQFAVERARAQNFQVMWLGVWEHNEGAIRFYQRFGMKKCGSHIFQLGNDPQTDWIMWMDL